MPRSACTKPRRDCARSSAEKTCAVGVVGGACVCVCQRGGPRAVAGEGTRRAGAAAAAAQRSLARWLALARAPLGPPPPGAQAPTVPGTASPGRSGCCGTLASQSSGTTRTLRGTAGYPRDAAKRTLSAESRAPPGGPPGEPHARERDGGRAMAPLAPRRRRRRSLASSAAGARSQRALIPSAHPPCSSPISMPAKRELLGSPPLTTQSITCGAGRGSGRGCWRERGAAVSGEQPRGGGAGNSSPACHSHSLFCLAVAHST